MANKRRPKKTKAPYKCYGPNGLIKTIQVSAHKNGRRGLTLDDEEDEEDDLEQSDVTMSSLDDYSALANSLNETMNLNLKGELMEFPVDFSKFKKNDSKVPFPTEINQLILFFTTELKLDPKYLRVCKEFYFLYLPFLYKKPVLDSYNFFKFVETVSAPRSKIGSFVNYLDLSTIIQSGKNSYVSKLLRRCSQNLEIFIAPQTSFGYAPLISLRGCKNIKILDLGLVSETVNLNELFHAIENLTNLTHLSFPRSSIEIDLSKTSLENSVWPSNLWYLRLSGGITDEFVTESSFPQTIKRLEFAHCPQLKDFAIYSMLSKFGESLTHLSIQYPMPGLTETSLDFLFTYCPNLLFLQIYVDYCSRLLFNEDQCPELFDKERPLRTLWLDSSGGLGQSSKIHPDDLTIAIMEERLPCLKHVRVTVKLGWDLKGDDVSDLINLLEEKDGGLYVNYH